MFDPELEQAVAKMQKGDAPMSKADQYAQLRKFSNRQRLPTETPEKAFVKFITTDPDGKQLYARYAQTKAGASAATGRAPTPDQARDVLKAGGGLETLHEIATAIQTKFPELRLSKSAAIAAALETEVGKEAYVADRKARTGIA